MDFATSPSSSSSSAPKCSICMDDVTDMCGRTVVKLRCSHLFHLDCIGSAFNMKGVMECPNCRKIENGVWRCFENASPDAEFFEGIEQEEVDVIDMGDGTIVRRNANDEWEMEYESSFMADADGNIIDPYAVFAGNTDSNDRHVPNVVLPTQIDWRFDPVLICDGCIHSYSTGAHTGGANSASVRSATLSARPDLNDMPNEPFGSRVVEHGVGAQNTFEPPSNFTYHGLNDPFRRRQQPPTNSPAPVERTSIIRPIGSTGWFLAERAAPSREQTAGSSFSWSMNLNSNLSELATHRHHHVQE